MSELVRDGVQRRGDLAKMDVALCTLGEPDKQVTPALLCYGNLPYYWNGTRAPSFDVQEPYDAKLVAIRDEKQRIICLFPENEWNTRRGRGILAQDLFRALEEQPDFHRLSQSKLRFAGGFARTGERPPPLRRSTAIWATGNHGADSDFDLEEEDQEETSSIDGDADARRRRREFRQGAPRVNRGADDSASKGVTTVSPSDPASDVTPAGLLVLRAQRNWEKFASTTRSKEEGRDNLLPQSRQRLEVLARVLRAGDCSPGRTKTWNPDDQPVAKDMRLCSDVSGDQKQSCEPIITHGGDNKPGTTLDVLPGGDDGKSRFRRFAPGEKALELGGKVLTRNGYPVRPNTSRSMVSPKLYGSNTKSSLRREGNVSGPGYGRSRQFASVRLSRMGSESSCCSEASNEPSDGVTIGSVDSPSVHSEESDHSAIAEAFDKRALYKAPAAPKLLKRSRKASTFEFDESDSDDET